VSEPLEYIRACAVSDLPDDGVIGIDINGQPVAIVRTEGEVFALEDVCSHADECLSEGDVNGYDIECAAHGSRFDVRTGKVCRFPARKPVRIYPVRIEGHDVLVSLAPRTSLITQE
jgi:3-phenylpropionate/trans-cinnamate dioxygenase ferredoxin subunit